ncbi:hypothetical protein AHAS_Ahas19G0186700 [Arachis hypogaea]
MSRAAVTERGREKARCWRSVTRCAAVGPLPSSSKEQGRTMLGLRETEVEWREVEGELFALPFVPPLLSHSAAAAGSHRCATPSKAESHDGAPFRLLWSAERGAYGWRKASGHVAAGSIWRLLVLLESPGTNVGAALDDSDAAT